MLPQTNCSSWMKYRSARRKEYYGLKYARWALERKPDYEPAQTLILSLAVERAEERGKFGDLARTAPPVYALLADAPAPLLNDLLDRNLNLKRTAIVLPLTPGTRRPRRQERRQPASGARRRSHRFSNAASAIPILGFSLPPRPPSSARHYPFPAELRGRIVDILRRSLATDPAAPSTARGHALIADPDRTRGDTLADYLRGLGYDPEVVTNGRDLFRRIAHASDFDLIFVDQHTANPLVKDIVGHLRADLNASRRPLFVVASPDQPRPPTGDQILLRFAVLIAVTDNDRVNLPSPFVPDLSRPPAENETNLKFTQERRDNAFRSLAANRIARLERVFDSLGLQLTDAQRFMFRLRVQQITAAVIAAEFPVTPESSPLTFRLLGELNKQIFTLPPTPDYLLRVGRDGLFAAGRAVGGRCQPRSSASQSATTSCEAASIPRCWGYGLRRVEIR